ncbi:hypothetical protein LTR08_001281 [Meristemomyces frigidus]|nr:hypothetical protein LTR08_001281 [Meristemomyces frigidus]
MVSLPQRMRKLQTKLLAIRLGSGALVLPHDVARIHMRFAAKINGGHRGPRDFWRHELVRLKYHNPTVPMTIDRTLAATDAAVMEVHFSAPRDSTSDTPPTATTTTSPATSPPPTRLHPLPLTHLTAPDILAALVALTKATPVEATPEERDELQMLEQHRVKSARDSKLSLEVRARQRREAELLEQARGDVATA